MLRILYDDLDQKVKNIYDEMDLHHSYKKKRVFDKLIFGLISWFDMWVDVMQRNSTLCCTVASRSIKLHGCILSCLNAFSIHIKNLLQEIMPFL